MGGHTGYQLQLIIDASLQRVSCGRDFRKKTVKRGKNGLIIQGDKYINNPEQRFLRIHNLHLDDDKEGRNVQGSNPIVKRYN